MPIVNTTFEETVNADGTRSIVVRNFDQEGKEYKHSHPAADALFDVTADNAIKVAALNEQLATQEFEALIGQG